MLVYIRNSCIGEENNGHLHIIILTYINWVVTILFVGDVLQDVNDDSIPQSLVKRFAEEK